MKNVVAIGLISLMMTNCATVFSGKVTAKKTKFINLL